MRKSFKKNSPKVWTAEITSKYAPTQGVVRFLLLFSTENYHLYFTYCNYDEDFPSSAYFSCFLYA